MRMILNKFPLILFYLSVVLKQLIRQFSVQLIRQLLVELRGNFSVILIRQFSVLLIRHSSVHPIGKFPVQSIL